MWWSSLDGMERTEGTRSVPRPSQGSDGRVHPGCHSGSFSGGGRVPKTGDTPSHLPESTLTPTQDVRNVFPVRAAQYHRCLHAADTEVRIHTHT